MIVNNPREQGQGVHQKKLIQREMGGFRIGTLNSQFVASFGTIMNISIVV
mgnify:CR=1 FL=1